MEEIHDGFLKKNMYLKDELNRKEIPRGIWNYFDVYRKCRSDPWMKVHEKCEKTHILGTFRGLLPVQVELLPVELRFWSFLAKFYR